MPVETPIASESILRDRLLQMLAKSATFGAEVANGGQVADQVFSDTPEDELLDKGLPQAICIFQNSETRDREDGVADQDLTVNFTILLRLATVSTLTTANEAARMLNFAAGVRADLWRMYKADCQPVSGERPPWTIQSIGIKRPPQFANFVKKNEDGSETVTEFLECPLGVVLKWVCPEE